MKSIFSILIFVFLILSCGKYEKPFISFRSAENRLTDKTWNCIKVLDTNANEFQIVDRIKFEINGKDSIFTRITNHQPLYLSNTSEDVDTVVGTWTWLYALKGKRDKQRIRLIYSGANGGFHNKVINISILTNSEFQYQDKSFDNSIYTYESN